MEEVFELKFILNSDTRVLYFLNCRIRCNILDWLFLIVTQLGSAAFTVLLSLSVLITGYLNNSALYCNMALSLAISHLIGRFIKKRVKRIRPYDKINGINNYKAINGDYSFPSGHTIAAFSVFISLSYVLPQLTLFFITIAFLVGCSRIYLGVHYPTDVIIGGIIGSMVTINVHSLLVLILGGILI